MKHEEINLKFEDTLDYVPITKMYGRAEFIICPKYVRGILRKIYIQRLQQIGMNYIYVLDLEKEFPNCKIRTFQITSWCHLNDNPYTWREFWCKEHNALAHNVYVPDDTNQIEFDFHFGSEITIRFVKRRND